MTSPRTPPPSKHQQGFTLLELLVTLAILGVLASLAAPSFASLFERWQTNQAASTLESAMLYARSESIRRGGGLVLVRQASSEDCSTQGKDSDWRCGWILATAANKTTALHASNQAFPNIAITASAAGDEIHLDRWGGMSLNNSSNSFSFTLHHKNTNANAGKKLCIASSGMAHQIAGDSNCSN